MPPVMPASAPHAQQPGTTPFTWQQGQQPYPPQPPAHGSPPPGYALPPQAPRHDPATYDLGTYSLPSSQPQAPAPGLRTGRPQPAADHGQQWSPQPVDPYPFGGQQPGPPLGQQHGYGEQNSHGYGEQTGGNHQAGQHEQDAAYDEDVEYEEEPPRRRRWLVAAALIGSIGFGGGLAYAYKTFSGPKNGAAQVVKAPRDPAKVAPTERGGKQFANTTNSTVMNRVPPEGSVASAGGTTDSTGVRRVSTVPVDRNLAPMPPPPAGAGVPGMVMVGGPPPMPTAPSASFEPPSARLPSPQAQRMAAAPPPPPVVNKQPPAPRTPPPEAAEAPPARPAATKTAAVAAAPAVPKVKPAGYVAVLGYQRSQMEAMKMMADLQQKYDALRDKKLEIVQSDQTSRGLGVIYRVVVGPAGSIAPAKEVCQQLFQAGMRPSGCYPLASN